MATQCRSSKCTAERKGFRRELDSWRHKLVHCVGFESILEGIYGPRLLRDLSIFDDCEPDVVSDWSVDASCSFCNLQLEKLSDHIPIVSSPQSTPTEETPPQGQSNTENIECHADKFLHAIFRKKDLPQSCDPNIPLVAQELMKKMIHQFAIEYASKSQIEGAKNVSSVDVDPECCSLQHPPDQDGPLDLTVNRNQVNVEQADGVLDLSKKNCASSTLSASTTASTNQKASGSLVPAGDVQVHLDAREEKFEARSTTLEMVLSSLCPYHKTLLYHILKCLREDYSVSAHCYKNAHRHFSAADDPLCCHLADKLHQDMYSFGDYKMSNGCYVQACRLNAFSVAPVCICLKDLHCLSCQSVAIGCINNMVGPGSCGCYPHHQRCPCSCQNYVDGAYITPDGNVAGAPFPSQKACDSYHPCTRGCSPSPPPLSPMPSDVNVKIGDKAICSLADGRSCSSPPPSLFPHEEMGDAILHRDHFDKDVSSEETGMQKGNEEGTESCTEARRCLERRQSGTLIRDLMERINEKFKMIEPQEKEQSLNSTANQSLECSDDLHLGKIITTVLHNDDNHDYTLKELLHQHESAVERKPIQTRFRRRQEALTAMANSPDLPSSRRQSLQIKRELATLDQSLCKSKPMQEQTRNQNARLDTNTHSPCSQVSPVRSEMEEVTVDVACEVKNNSCDNWNSHTHNTELHPCSSEMDAQKYVEKEEHAISMKGMSHGSGDSEVSSEKQSWLSQPSNCSDSGRSRRNIVPPQRFSSYVTEPRKMYFAACFSESIFIRRAPKDKVLKDTDTDSSSPNVQRSEVSREPNDQKEPSNAALNTERQGDDDHACSKLTEENQDNSSRTTSEACSQSVYVESKAVEDCSIKRSSPRRIKGNEVAPKSHARPKSSATHDHIDSQLHNVTSKDHPPAIKNVPVCNEWHSVPQYTSPIRLMFVSPVVSEDGVRYTLKSAVSGSSDHGEMFDPCEESSWGGTAKTTVKEQHRDSKVAPLRSCVSRDVNDMHKKPVTIDHTSRSEPLNGEHENQKETCPLIPETTSSPLKRKPGRPKKLGPQIEKPAKRPIGRPPKHKVENSKCSPNKGHTNATNKNSTSISCEDGGEKNNKNLKITVVYGRSRRIKRLVSEDSGHFRKDQQTELQDDQGEKGEIRGNIVRLRSNDSCEKLPEGQTENFNFVGPVKDRKCAHPPSSKIRCQKQKRSVTMRKPGRPPKVKISGISVTVTTVSPKQRKIRINSDMAESGGEKSQQTKAIPSDQNTPKEQTTINSVISHDGTAENVETGTLNGKAPVVPLRHSARERKPSIHLLHSVATSRAFTHNLLRRSRKLLLNKASGEPNQIKSVEKSVREDTDAVLSERASREQCGQDLNFLSTVSADSIFTSNKGFKWWPTSASTETLNEELTRRIQLMSDTWITDAVESSNSCSTERETDLKARMCSKVNDFPKSSVSAVKMLFQKHCNMDDLCAWFMQTTETQSLAIVKKASTRNPFEIIQYNPNRATKRINVCPSPQAERLRKHVKKFAKIVPKSPLMHLQAQEQIARNRSLHVKRRLFLRSSSTVGGSFHRRSLWSRGNPLEGYKSNLLRVKSKFMTRKRMSKWSKKQCPSTMLLDRAPSGAVCKNVLTPAKEFQPQIENTTLPVDTVHHSLNFSTLLERESAVQQAQKTMGTTDVGQKENVSSKTWSPETMRECRVFLKKINSPETKSTAEESDFCTVKLCNVSSSAYGSPIRTENEERGKLDSAETDAFKMGRTRRSTRRLSSQYPEEQWVHTVERKGKRKSHYTRGSQPAKKARQSEWKADRKEMV